MPEEVGVMVVGLVSAVRRFDGLEEGGGSRRLLPLLLVDFLLPLDFDSPVLFSFVRSPLELLKRQKCVSVRKNKNFRKSK